MIYNDHRICFQGNQSRTKKAVTRKTTVTKSSKLNTLRKSFLHDHTFPTALLNTTWIVSSFKTQGEFPRTLTYPMQTFDEDKNHKVKEGIRFGKPSDDWERCSWQYNRSEVHREGWHDPTHQQKEGARYGATECKTNQLIPVTNLSQALSERMCSVQPRWLHQHDPIAVSCFRQHKRQAREVYRSHIVQNWGRSLVQRNYQRLPGRFRDVGRWGCCGGLKNFCCQCSTSHLLWARVL